MDLFTRYTDIFFYDQLKKTHITQTKANGDQTENKKQNKHILKDFGVDTSVQRCVVTVTILVYKRYASFALWVGSVSWEEHCDFTDFRHSVTHRL